MISPDTLLVDKPDISPEEYFDHHQSIFLKVCESSASTEKKYYRLGPFCLEFIFPNAHLVSRVTPAFAHLEITTPGKVDLSIGFWDSASTFEKLSPPPWNRAQGGFISFHGGAYYHKYNSVSGCLYSFNAKHNTACFWIGNYKNIPYYESGAPILSILNWWLKDTAYQLVHGGALGQASGGVLLIGRGGSGKSTTCASALRSELFYAGDDYSLVKTDGEPRAYGIFNSAKIRPDMLQHFDHLKGALFNSEKIPEEKPLYFLYPHFKERLIKEFPLKAIFIPQVTNTPQTSIEPASPADTLRALAPSTIFQLSGLGKEILFKTTRLVQSLPCYFLKLGNRPEEVPDKIAAFLQGTLS